MAAPLIRRAVVADAEAGARCHAICWQEAYDGIVSPDRLAAALDLGRRTERWRTALEDGAERWVAYPVILWLLAFGGYFVGRFPGLSSRR